VSLPLQRYDISYNELILFLDNSEFAQSGETDVEGASAHTTAVSSSKSSGEEDRPLLTKRKVGKDPTVDTSFLPDRERDERLQRERERLQREWLEEQERIKNEVC